MKASQIVEAVLFASDAPLKADEIARADESLDEDRVEAALLELRTTYDESERAWQIHEVAEGYQLLTRPEFAPYLERFDTVPRPSRLSGPALETLAIIAYRQPIGRVEIEYIRGVSSSGVIRSLQDRALVEVVGRAEGLGRPLLYGTTSRFLEHFGFSSLDDLPRPEELPIVLRERIAILDDDDDEGAETEDPDQLRLDGVDAGADAPSDGVASDDEPAGDEDAPVDQADSPGEAAPADEADAAGDTDPGADPGPEDETEAGSGAGTDVDPDSGDDSAVEPDPEKG